MKKQQMRTKEEIIKRISDIEGYLELSREFGKYNSNEKNKLHKEIQVLDWVLGEQELRVGVVGAAPVREKIFEYLNQQTKPRSSSEITYFVGYSDASVAQALRRLVELRLIERSGEFRQYKYIIK